MQKGRGVVLASSSPGVIACPKVCSVVEIQDYWFPCRRVKDLSLSSHVCFYHIWLLGNTACEPPLNWFSGFSCLWLLFEVTRDSHRRLTSASPPPPTPPPQFESTDPSFTHLQTQQVWRSQSVILHNVLQFGFVWWFPVVRICWTVFQSDEY